MPDTEGSLGNPTGSSVFLQMIRGRGVKVKEFVLNGSFGRLYGTKGEVNGCHKSIDVFASSKRSIDRHHDCYARNANLPHRPGSKELVDLLAACGIFRGSARGMRESPWARLRYAGKSADLLTVRGGAHGLAMFSVNKSPAPASKSSAESRSAPFVTCFPGPRLMSCCDLPHCLTRQSLCASCVNHPMD
jgi:hypothetical protein